MQFSIITLFPETIAPYLDASILGKAQKRGTIKVRYYNPRDFARGPHKHVDDKPFGGGPGMVMQVEPIIKAARKAQRDIDRKKDPGKTRTIILAASGKEFTQTYAKRLATRYDNLILIAGHYEGIDARVKKILKAEEVSIGPYVLSGGELPAMVVVDTVSRQLPGVLGNVDSLEELREASSEIYTRPAEFHDEGKTWRVPEVLRSGDHARITEWRARRSKKRP